MVDVVLVQVALKPGGGCGDCAGGAFKPGGLMKTKKTLSPNNISGNIISNFVLIIIIRDYQIYISNKQGNNGGKEGAGRAGGGW